MNFNIQGKFFLLFTLISIQSLFAQIDSIELTKKSPTNADTVKAVNVGYGVKREQETIHGACIINPELIQQQTKQNIRSVFKGLLPSIYIFNSDVRYNFEVYPSRNSSLISSQPLYIVDDVPYTNIDFLSIEDVKQMTIVDDGVYTALYGSLARKGVVIISTKKDTSLLKPGKWQIEKSNFQANRFVNSILNMYYNKPRYSLSFGGAINNFLSSAHFNSSIHIIKSKKRNILSLGETFILNSKIQTVDAGSNSKSKNILGSIFAQLNPIKEITIRSSMSLNYTHGYIKIIDKYIKDSTAGFEEYVADVYNQSKQWTLSNTITYKPDLNLNHNLTFLLGHEYRSLMNPYYNWNNDNQKMIYLLPKYGFSEGMGISVYDRPYKRIPNSDYIYNNYYRILEDFIYTNSLFGQLSYSYKNKYLLDIVFRADSASVENFHQWTYLPAVSGAWVVSNESFWTNKAPLFCKLWVSWKQYDVDYWDSKQSTSSTNVGINLNSLNNVFQSSFWWNNKITDRKSGVPESELYYGSYDSKSNALNIMLTYSKNKGQFNFSTTGMFTYNQSKYLKTNAPIGNPMYSSPDYLTGYYIDPKNKVLDSWEEIDAYKQEFNLAAQYSNPIIDYMHIPYFTDLNPGDYRLVDINKDSLLNFKDHVFLGKIMPDFVFGLQLNFNYKNGFFQIVGKGATGATIVYREFLINTFRIEEFNYFKISNITIGYDFAPLSKLADKLQEFKIFMSMSDLLTFSNSGFIPHSLGNRRLISSLTVGINLKF
ncbi:MAG: hypothetical protein IPO21_16125 [Bacteroidales bacterium]|nr:hypothetical protein [Bacteroidales bacterium]